MKIPRGVLKHYWALDKKCEGAVTKVKKNEKEHGLFMKIEGVDKHDVISRYLQSRVDYSLTIGVVGTALFLFFTALVESYHRVYISLIDALNRRLDKVIAPSLQGESHHDSLLAVVPTGELNVELRVLGALTIISLVIIVVSSRFGDAQAVAESLKNTYINNEGTSC